MDISASSWIMSLGLRGEVRQETDESYYGWYLKPRQELLWGASEDRPILNRQESEGAGRLGRRTGFQNGDQDIRQLSLKL